MTSLPMPSAPTVHLERVSYPEYIGFNARISAFQVVGTENIKHAIDMFASYASTTGAVRDVAMDIETHGTDATTWWEVTCLTAAFHTGVGIISVLFDPLRNPEHRKLIRRLVELSSRIVFHNSSFDLPPLVAHRILELDDIDKVWDTLVLARMLNTSARAGRSLEDLSKRYRLLPDDGITISKVFSAGGHKTIQSGFSESDINGGTYRDGAMSDTVVTLQLLPVLERAVERRHDASTQSMGAAFPSAEGARHLIWRMQRVNQICARRAARGYRYDPEFPEKFDAGTRDAYREACDFLANQGLEPGRGDKLIERMHGLGQLPDNWPRTKTGQLSADKKAMEKLKELGEGAILAKMHLIVAETSKVSKYLEKVVEQGQATGRVHPGIGVLAASASGRMSVNNPELHQFPGNARGIILADDEPGWTSVDWSSIEPVVMAVCAGDNDFINPFYEGNDLYVPVARAAGLIPATVPDADAKNHKGRKVAKVILLAGMYGQGAKALSESLSAALKENVDRDAATDLSNTIKRAMPVTFDFMDNIQSMAEGKNAVTTIAGRVLDEDAGYTYRAVNHFCITPDTPVLTADLRHVRADSVQVGDELVGFDEYSLEKNKRGGGKRRFRTAVVKNVNYVWKPSVEVHTSDGKVTVCSEDHKWFVRHPGMQPRLLWVESMNLTTEYQMMSLDTWDSPDTHEAGYLAGLFDGEGSMQTRSSGSSCSQLTFHQKPGNGVMERFREAMDNLGLTYTFIPKSPNNTSPCDGIRVSGVPRMLKTVGTLRPHRMITRAKEIYEGADLFGEKTMNSTPYVVKVVPIGVRKLVAIETSTHTFVANGFLSHNCQGSAADVLYDATLRADEEGLTDHIHLWMHDELVVDTSVQGDINRIMQTPPESLKAWARTERVELQTDANPMGMEWKSV